MLHSLQIVPDTRLQSLRDLFPAPWGVDCDENTIKDYVKEQGLKYQKIHEDRQLALF